MRTGGGDSGQQHRSNEIATKLQCSFSEISTELHSISEQTQNTVGQLVSCATALRLVAHFACEFDARFFTRGAYRTVNNIVGARARPTVHHQGLYKRQRNTCSIIVTLLPSVSGRRKNQTTSIKRVVVSSHIWIGCFPPKTNFRRGSNERINAHA